MDSVSRAARDELKDIVSVVDSLETDANGLKEEINSLVLSRIVDNTITIKQADAIALTIFGLLTRPRDFLVDDEGEETP